MSDVPPSRSLIGSNLSVLRGTPVRPKAARGRRIAVVGILTFASCGGRGGAAYGAPGGLYDSGPDVSQTPDAAPDADASFFDLDAGVDASDASADTLTDARDASADTLIDVDASTDADAADASLDVPEAGSDSSTHADAEAGTGDSAALDGASTDGS